MNSMERCAHKLRFTLVSAMCGMALCACDCTRPQTNPMSNEPASTAPATTVSAPSLASGENQGKLIISNDQTVRVHYVTIPGSIIVSEPFAIELRVESPDGQAADDLTVSVDAGMPEHAHGMNVEPTVKPLGRNTFRIDNMVFHMTGRWEVYFDVTRDGMTSRAQDEITLE